ncbi:MAG: hypothetical protein ACREM2_06540, partial [Vulcanimicrobiaceae bacterium]
MNDRAAERLAGAVLCLGIPDRAADGLGAPTRAALEALQPGGIILFEHNLGSRDETVALLEAVRTACADAPFVMVDHEGGRVARLRT